MISFDKILVKMIEENGAQKSLELFKEALVMYANDCSDKGLKEKAYEAADLSDLLDAMFLAGDPDYIPTVEVDDVIWGEN
jgi:hypothetical protein